MSGVSVTSGNVDLDTLAAGGAAFVDRLAQFKAAKDAADAAVANLALGRDAREALDAAARTLDEAKAEAENIKAQALRDATQTQKTVSDWAAGTRDAAAQALMRADAKESDATARLAAASATLDAANKAKAESDDKIAAAKASLTAAYEAGLGKLG